MLATAPQLAALVQQEQAAEARALEEQAAAQADGGAAVALAALLPAALTGWVATFGALSAAGERLALARYLAGVRASVDRAGAGLGLRAERALEGALAEATELGARRAVDFARRASGRDVGVPDVEVSDAVWVTARGLAAAVREQLRLAARLLQPRTIQASGWRGVVTALAAARRAATMARTAVSAGVHRAVNDGAAQVAQQLGARMLWVAEPTACTRCVAYSGRLAGRDGFPGGLSMDPAQRRTGQPALDGPPAHPNCRCAQVPWLPAWGGGPTGLPALLQDQALRSVAAGRAGPGESRAARRRAAHALLIRRGISPRVRRQATATAAGR